MLAVNKTTRTLGGVAVVVVRGVRSVVVMRWSRCGCHGGDGGGGWRVVASGIGDRIDRVIRNVFGVRRKSFSSAAAAAVVAGGWPAEPMAWQTDYCIMKEGMSTLRGRKSVPRMNSSEREVERGITPSSRELHDKELDELLVHDL
nr:hypothetical protein [Tanacetum cinerariifolium]